MQPQFDELKQIAFAHILDVMGEEAVWINSQGEEETGRVLHKYPTMPMTIGDTDTYQYPPNTPTAEFFKDTFIGIKEQSDKQNTEYLIIRDKKYFVTLVDTRFDGDTYVAHLQLIQDE